MSTTDDLEGLAEVFGLLADPGRLRMVVALLDGGELCVHDLAQLVGSSGSATSHALRLLRAHRIVTARRDGRHVHYRLADAHVAALVQVALDHHAHTGAVRVVRRRRSGTGG